MRIFKFVLVSALIAAAMSGCSDRGNVVTPMAEIQGQVYSVATPGPTPVGWVPPPLETISTVLVLTSNHIVIFEVLTDSKGRFSSSLDPGTYYLRVKEMMIPSETGPYTVKSGELLSVRANYDNGMR
jgi:hypothetical protein